MQGVEKQTKSATAQFKAFRTAAVAAVGALGVRELVQAANQFANINNQLKVITNSEEDLVVTSAEVLRIANDTGVAYAAQADLVARIARANSEIGASGTEVLAVSQAVAESFALAGASATETTNATLQLGQALASGRLQGDELRSILENNSVLARVIADDFGVSVGQLRELAAAGEVTSDRVFGAILKQSDDINQQFSTFAPTLERAGQAVSNSFVNAVGQLDQALGLTSGFASALLEATDIVDEQLVPSLVDGLAGFQTFTQLTLAQIALVVNSLDEAFAGVSISVAEARDESSTLDDILQAVGESAGAFGSQFDDLPAGLRELAQLAATPLTGIANSLAEFDENTRSAEEATKDLTAAEIERLSLLDAIEEIQRKAADAETARALDREERAERLKNLQLGADIVERPDDALAKAQEKAADSAADLVEELRAENAELVANAVFGDEAANVLQRRAALEVAAADGAEQFSGAIRTQLDLLEQSREAAEAAENARDDDTLIAGLEEELRLLQLTTEERIRQVEIANLSADATETQIQRVGELASAIAAAEEETTSLNEFFSETLAEQTAIGVRGALRGVFAGEFDDIKGDFGNFLSDLGEELLSSLFLQLLSNTFSGLAAGGGAGAGIFGALGQAFGGNRRFGGSVIGGQPNIVNEKQGGEIFMPPPGGGRIFPDATAAGVGGQQQAPQISIINSVDPAGALFAQETAAGREVSRNNVDVDKEFYQQFLGA